MPQTRPLFDLVIMEYYSTELAFQVGLSLPTLIPIPLIRRLSEMTAHGELLIPSNRIIGAVTPQFTMGVGTPIDGVKISDGSDDGDDPIGINWRADLVDGNPSRYWREIYRVR